MVFFVFPVKWYTLKILQTVWFTNMVLDTCHLQIQAAVTDAN